MTTDIGANSLGRSFGSLELLRRQNSSSVLPLIVSDVLQNFRDFCAPNKAPKGFEKFFRDKKDKKVDQDGKSHKYSLVAI
jgi:hypothetical protein